jgi:acyl carrier protein
MNYDEALKTVKGVICTVIREQGGTPPEITESTVLLGGELPIDSLDLGVIVIELQQRFSYDPFKDGIVDFRTVGELTGLYCREKGL